MSIYLLSFRMISVFNQFDYSSVILIIFSKWIPSYLGRLLNVLLDPIIIWVELKHLTLIYQGVQLSLP